MQDVVQRPDGDSLLQDIKLRAPEDFGPGERPTVSLHLLVKNGESCLPRLLMNLGPYLDEVVAVVNDTTDGTVGVLRDFVREQGEREGRPPVGLKIFEVTSGSHPHLYLLDEAETYARGPALAGEVLDVPLTGRPLLADWAGARNIGWSECTSDFILFLDSDDELLDPRAIPGVCDLMNRQGIDLVATRYRYAVGPDGRTYSDSYRERIARNRAGISWQGVTHEVLRGSKRTAYVDGNLVVVDHKDSLGIDVRIPGRCLKVLYHHGRSNNWQVDARTFLYLGQEAKVCQPELAAASLERYLDLSSWPEERAWACSMMGEIHEAAERYPEASGWYERALCEHPGSKAAYRLCRSRFAEKKWSQVVDAHEMGVANESVLQVLDSGPAYRDMTKILVAAARDQLASEEPDPGVAAHLRIAAWLTATEALAAFPENSALALLRSSIVGSMDQGATIAAAGEILRLCPGNSLVGQLVAELAAPRAGGGST